MKQRGNLLLLAFVVVCLLSLVFGPVRRRGGEDDAPTVADATAEAVVEVVAAAPDRVEPDAAPIRLLVLNGAGVAGLAGETGLDVAMIGCVAERVDDAPHARFGRTLLINRKLASAVAAELATRLGGVPVLVEKDARAGEDAVLVLGADHRTVRDAIRAGAGR